MVHVIQLAFGAFMSSLGVKRHPKSYDGHDCIQPFGKNESAVIGKSQRLQNEGHARINKVSALRRGLSKIIETVCISTYFECPDTDC